MLPPSPQATAGIACGHVHHQGGYALAPQVSEVVVFTEHFTRGLGLPTSIFFRRFLMHFGLQPHHLSANIVLQLAAFIALCEGYLGIEPHLDLWRRLFYFKELTVVNETTNVKEMTACGAALVYHRTGASFRSFLCRTR
ncbi:retrotransposon protein [Hordeum vulgare]|nr:retrotransposon protein [Hordeum vulgare]